MDRKYLRFNSPTVCGGFFHELYLIRLFKPCLFYTKSSKNWSSSQ